MSNMRIIIVHGLKLEICHHKASFTKFIGTQFEWNIVFVSTQEKGAKE